MFHCSIAFITSHDERGTIYTVRCHMRDNHVPTSVNFRDWGTAMDFACKVMTLSLALDNVAFHTKNGGYYAHN